jgi:hypothetical protein
MVEILKMSLAEEGMTYGSSIFAYLVFGPGKGIHRRDGKAHEDSGLVRPRSKT